jgi:TetR/AcrR family transcriptional regulator, tetracycline repressor protein
VYTRQVGLTRERIVSAAIEVAEREGPAALGIRRVARELEVTPMALYRYVASKEELLDLVRGSLYERLDVQARRSTSWREELRELARAFRRLVRELPAAPALMAGGSGESEEERRICDLMLRSFRRAGFDAETAELLYLQFSHFVLALVRLEAEQRSREPDGFALGLELFLGGVAKLPRKP